jgi:hypothetical protein
VLRTRIPAAAWADGDRLGLLGWSGCGAIMAGILLAEPAAADALKRVLRPD